MGFLQTLSVRPADGVLLIVLFVIFWSLLRLHQNSTVDFNLMDLVLEGGKISKISFLVMGAFVLTSWMMIRLTLDGKLTEGYLGLYSGAWIAPLIARMFAQPPG